MSVTLSASARASGSSGEVDQDGPSLDSADLDVDAAGARLVEDVEQAAPRVGEIKRHKGVRTALS